MSSGNKLTRAFRKFAAKGVFIALSIPASIGAGVYTIEQVDHHYATKAPVQNVALHDAAMQKVEGMGADFLALDAKTRFDKLALDEARDKGRLGADALKQGYAALDKDKQAEKDLLSAYRRELLLNPVLSEADAAYLYGDLFWYSGDKAGQVIQDNLSPLTGALAYRDQVKAALNFPADPAKVTPQMTAQLLEKAGALADGNYKQDKDEGLAVGGGLLSSLFGLSLAARRKNKREEKEEDARESAERKKRAAAAPPRRDPEPAPEQDAAPKKPDHKFSL